MTPALISALSRHTGFPEDRCETIARLLEDGATVPFLARYRKEATGGATDEELREFSRALEQSRRLVARREEVSRLIAERGTLDKDLSQRLLAASTLSEIEDLYRPFKEKRNTRAGQAILRGLEPLADIISMGVGTAANRGARLDTPAKVSAEAARFLGPEVKSPEAALSGAKDILAERYADDPRERGIIRDQTMKYGIIETKPGKKFDPKGIFANYSGVRERISTVSSHRFLAIMRAAREEQLTVRISFDTDRLLEGIRRYRVPRSGGACAEIFFDACKDGLKRLLLPSLEREIFSELKIRSDKAAISVFGKNLTQLLLTRGVKGMNILGVDPALRTGCKLAAVDQNGVFLDHAVIFPTPPANDFEGSMRTVAAMVRKHKIAGVAIGNGTGSRETQEFFARFNRESGMCLQYTVVSEAGASVYSASEAGSIEFPNLDVTIRGAISIARRLLDPMAELVKIDAKSLGIGQYQHDVDQKLLEGELADVTENLVNRVGVDLNRASEALLRFVSGIGPVLAKNIAARRKETGGFKNRAELLKVKGLGRRTYEQCAGFMRIRGGTEGLDNTGVHPENYEAAKVVSELSSQYRSRLVSPDAETADPELYALSKRLSIGTATLRDIIFELEKPGFDPRDDLPAIPFKEDLIDIKSLKEGSIVSGVVRNICDFGAFVDIGLKNDGLIHISQISPHRVSHPQEILSVNQFLSRIRVVGVDIEKGRVGLSLLDGSN